MIQALMDAFDGEIADCLTETNSIIIEVFDCYDSTPAEKKSYIKTEEDQPIHFTLNNPSAISLIFAALDNCILRSGESS